MSGVGPADFVRINRVQLPILRTLALVAVGNAALRGRDVGGFWPNDPMFQYTASLDFMTPRENRNLAHAAAGPERWFAKLAQRRCNGLRMHCAPMREDPKLAGVPDYALVGMVGGGPRWLIEPVYGDHSELWEGFDRIGDKDAADKKVWMSAYVLIGEAQSAPKVDADLRGASLDLRAALTAIEKVARAMPGAPFAEAFAGARAALEDKGGPPAPDFVRFTTMKPEAVRLLRAAGGAWVFGAAGSWNDLKPDAAVKARYQQTTRDLFTALQRAVLSIANSTYGR